METSESFNDPVAISLVGVRRSFISTVGMIQAAYAIDLAIRLTCLSADATVFVDFSEEECEMRGQYQICFNNDLERFVMRHWLYMEVALSCGKLLGMVLISCLLLALSRQDRLPKVCELSQLALALQQPLTLVSISLFTFYFGCVYTYLHKDTKYVYAASVVVSALPLLFVEVTRRRLEGMRTHFQQLTVRGSARARADTLPRVRYADVESDPDSFQERGCPICLEDFSADETLAKLACGHVFHVNCIRIWLAGGFEFGCPLRCDVPARAPAPAAQRPPPDTVGHASAASRRRRRRRPPRSRRSWISL